MYYGALKKCDIANGAGVRVTLFVSGCTNHCPDCFQPQTWDFCYGRPFTHETETEIFRELDKPFVNGPTVLGMSPSSLGTSVTCCPSCGRSAAAIPGRISGASPASGWRTSCCRMAPTPAAR